MRVAFHLGFLMPDTASILCQFKFLCDKEWSDLRVIRETPGVRFCADCEKAVFLCTNYEDLRKHTAESHCVAVRTDSGAFRVGGI